MSGPSNRDIRKLYVYWFLQEFQLWIPVWIVFLTVDRGFTFTQVTVAEGLYLGGILALEVPTGAVADRYGRSRSMALGAFLLGLSILIFAFTTSFAILVASFMLWAVAHTLMSGADKALLFDILKAAGREAEYERLAGRAIALLWAGVGTATLLGGPVAALTSVRTTIFIGAVTCCVAAAVALSIRENVVRHEGEQAASYAGSIRDAFGEAWKAVDVRIVIIVAGSSVALLEAAHYLVQPFLISRDIEVGAWFSLLQVPVLAAGLVGALLADRLAARMGTPRALMLLPLAGAGAYTVVASTPGMLPYAMLPLVIALASCLDPITTGYINRRIGSERRATVLSMAGMFRALVMAALVPALGYTTDHWGLGQAFALGAVLTVTAVAVLAPFVIRWVARTEALPVPELEPVGAPGQ